MENKGVNYFICKPDDNYVINASDMHPLAGTCEYHGGYGHDLSSTTFPIEESGKIEDKNVRELVENGPIYMCAGCRHAIPHSKKLYNQYKYTLVPMENIKEHREVIKKFLEIKNIFKLADIYLIRDEDVPDNYKGYINVAVEFAGMTFTSYFTWVYNSGGKNIFHLWDDKQDRSKFWSVQTGRVLMSLAKIHEQSENIRIWIKGYARVVSMDAFSKTPPKLVRLNSDFVLLKIKQSFLI